MSIKGLVQSKYSVKRNDDGVGANAEDEGNDDENDGFH